MAHVVGQPHMNRSSESQGVVSSVIRWNAYSAPSELLAWVLMHACKAVEFCTFNGSVHNNFPGPVSFEYAHQAVERETYKHRITSETIASDFVLCSILFTLRCSVQTCYSVPSAQDSATTKAESVQSKVLFPPDTYFPPPRSQCVSTWPMRRCWLFLNTDWSHSCFDQVRLRWHFSICTS